MRSKLLAENDGLRVYALVMDPGDEVLDCVRTFANQNDVTAAQFSAIGAFSKATLAYFDWEAKDYKKTPVGEQVEVAALTGDIALSPEGKPSVHIHTVLGRRDASAVAGHLIEGYVRPTLEIILHEMPKHLCKRHDPTSGLTLIDLENAP